MTFEFLKTKPFRPAVTTTKSTTTIRAEPGIHNFSFSRQNLNFCFFTWSFDYLPIFKLFFIIKLLIEMNVFQIASFLSYKETGHQTPIICHLWANNKYSWKKGSQTSETSLSILHSQNFTNESCIA